MAKTEVFQRDEATYIYNPHLGGLAEGVIIVGKNVTHTLHKITPEYNLENEITDRIHYEREKYGQSSADLYEGQLRRHSFTLTTPDKAPIYACPFENSPASDATISPLAPVPLTDLIKAEEADSPGDVCPYGLLSDVIREMKKYAANYRRDLPEEDIPEWRPGSDPNGSSPGGGRGH